MPTNQDNIFTRFDIYKMLMMSKPHYRGAHDYYSLERYLSAIYDCDCTDCSGPDISRECNVEKNFILKFGIIRKAKMV